MTKKIVKRTDANNETLYFYTHSDAVDVGEGSSMKSLTEVIDDTLRKSAQTLTNTEKTQVYANLGTESFVGDRAVRYDEAQVLGTSEKTQALTNLGLNGVDDVPTENSNNVVRSGGVKAAIDDFTNRGFIYKGIAPVSAPLGEDKTFYIAKSGDYTAYTGIGNGSFTLNGIAVLTYAVGTTSGAWTKNDIVLFDEEPTAGSDNLVKSGGVVSELATGGIYDISVKHPTGGVDGGNTYLTIDQAVRQIPRNLRRAGMTVKFISSVDGAYKIYQSYNTSIDNFHYINFWSQINSDSEPFNYFVNHNKKTFAYTEGLEYLYIYPQYFTVNDAVSARASQNKLYVNYNGVNLIGGMPFASIENGVPIDLVTTIDEQSVTIGVICFKDKSLWVNNPESAASYAYLSQSIVTDSNRLPKQLADGSVTTDKIADASVTPEKLANEIPLSKIRLTFFETNNTYTQSYEQGLQAFYINPTYFDNKFISSKHYRERFYVGERGTSGGVTNFFIKNFSEIADGQKVDITKEIDGNNVIVGYVVFKDKSKWTGLGNNTSNPQLNSNVVFNEIFHQNAGNSTPSETDSVKYTAQSLTDAQKSQARTNIDAESKQALVITIPNTIYAVVGTELNIWNDNVTLSIDRGLSSPLNYRVQWICGKGMQTERGFRYTPAASDVGINQTCVCYVYNMKNELLAQKTFHIKVLSQSALNSAKNIVFFGASMGTQTCEQLYGDFTNSSKYAGIIPNMIGTRGSNANYHYEAVGGYGWRDYATAGRHAYRVYVSGIGGLEVGAVYSITISGTSKNFTVREVNVNSGSGNILLEAQYGAEVADFPTSGTLTNVSGTGDATISFDNTGHDDGGEQPNNPLWDATLNDGQGGLNIAKYKQTLYNLGRLSSPTDLIDAVSFGFGQNDHALADNLDTLAGYIDALYTAFITDNPNCKFIMGFPMTGGNTVDGAGESYGASYNVRTYQDDVYRLRQFYLTYQNNSKYPNIRICPTSLEVDRYYGYNLVNRAISQRYPTNEKVHNNFLHPGTSGYGQLGDTYFASYIGVLTE